MIQHWKSQGWFGIYIRREGGLAVGRPPLDRCIQVTVHLFKHAFQWSWWYQKQVGEIVPFSKECYEEPVSSVLDRMLEKMQSPEQRQALEKAYHSSPKELADAAVWKAKQG